MRFLFIMASMLGLLMPLASWAASNQHDQRFIQQATIAGEAQVTFGELAAQQATAPAVQEFGRWMATDHAMANETLAAIARQEGVSAPEDLDAAHQEQYRQLQPLQGEAFDQAYLRHQLGAHEALFELYADEFRAGENRTLKAFAHHMLPMLRAQLEQVRILTGSAAVSEGKTAPETR